MLLKAVATCSIGFCTLQLPGPVQSVPAAPGTMVAIHGVTLLEGRNFVLEATPDPLGGLTFRTDNLPEEKNMVVTADLMRDPPEKQLLVLRTHDRSKQVTVDCQSVEVWTVRGAGLGFSRHTGHGKDCYLEAIF